MNLRARILGLMTLSALTLFSCEEDISTIGLPPESNLGIFFADVPLSDKTTQVWVNGVNTRNTGIALVGAYQDPNFGRIEAKNYSEVGIVANTYSSNATLDSAVIQVRIESVIGTNIEGVTHDFEVYQLADSIQLSQNGVARSFTSSNTEPIASKIGDMSFVIDTDSIGLTFSETGLDLANGFPDDSAYFDNFFDSEGEYIYLNKSKLEQSFAQNIFNELKTNQYDTAAEIAGLFKGIHLRAANTNGAIVSYDISDINTGVVFYYTEGADSKSVSYPLSNIRSFNNITPNEDNGWTGSDFDDLTNFYQPYSSNSDKAYFQSGTNLLLKVDLSEIRARVQDTVPDATIQSAEILITGGEDIDGLSKPENIVYWFTSLDSLASENYNVANLPSLSSGGLTFQSPVIAGINNDINGYKVEMPLALDFLFSTTTEEFEFDQLIIAPISNTSVSLPQSSIRRFSFDKDDFRLRFYYTIPDKDK